MNCKECKLFKKIKNTEETGVGLCSFPNSYFETKADNDCLIHSNRITCRDCERLHLDDACAWCHEDDSALDETGELCPGFIPKYRAQVADFLLFLKSHDMDYKNELLQIEKDVDAYLDRLRKRE